MHLIRFHEIIVKMVDSGQSAVGSGFMPICYPHVGSFWILGHEVTDDECPYLE